MLYFILNAWSVAVESQFTETQSRSSRIYSYTEHRRMFSHNSYSCKPSRHHLSLSAIQLAGVSALCVVSYYYADGRACGQGTFTEGKLDTGLPSGARASALRHSNGWRRWGRSAGCYRASGGPTRELASGELRVCRNWYKSHRRDTVDSISRGRGKSKRENTGVPMIRMSCCCLLRFSGV